MVMETRSTSGHVRQLETEDAGHNEQYADHHRRTHAICVLSCVSNDPQVYAGSAPVDDALGLADRSLNRPGVVHLDGGSDPDPTLDLPRELHAQRSTARYIALGRALDVHRERIERTRTVSSSW